MSPSAQSRRKWCICWIRFGKRNGNRFQDDVEAMYTVYSIGEASRKLQWAVENTLQCCELYNTNDMSRSDFMSTVKSIADDATVAANDAKEK